ncbi:hypothetical protein EWF95_02785 [Halonotius roseus]|uniref:Uncharacterized protein n=2 Tax=Halonotius roseus TaxID=2511997 RepID=A0A544QR24_9EURY|nr:hypothetical protein EWF95_02785 [Halonotius roseus]
MVGSNYPDGMTSRDFVRAGIDQPHHHEHEWREDQHDQPIFEDGAAIFFETCGYAEGRYGEGWECDESRTIRCELDRIEKTRDGGASITFLPSHEQRNPMLFEDALVGLETNKSHVQLLDIDPPNDYGDGFVRVQSGDYILWFSQ